MYSAVTYSQSFTLDTLNRISEVNIDGKVVVNYTYDELGNRLSKQVLNVNQNPDSLFLIENSVLSKKAEILEQQPKGTFISLLTIVDGDDSIHHYSLIGGPGSQDNMNFSIRSDSLFSDTVFDYSVQNKHYLRVRSIDGYGGEIEESFEVNILKDNIGLDEDYLLNEVSIFPNPGKDHFTVKNESSYQLTLNVYSVNGDLLIKARQIEPYSEVYLQLNFPPGVYNFIFFREKIDDKTWIKKVLVIK